MMSFTDQSPATSGSVSCELDKPAYDARNAAHAVSSRFRSCRLFTAHNLNVNPPHDARSLTLSQSSPSPTAPMPEAPSLPLITVLYRRTRGGYQRRAPPLQRPPTGGSGSAPGGRGGAGSPGAALIYGYAIRRHLSEERRPRHAHREIVLYLGGHAAARKSLASVASGHVTRRSVLPDRAPDRHAAQRPRAAGRRARRRGHQVSPRLLLLPLRVAGAQGRH